MGCNFGTGPHRKVLDGFLGPSHDPEAGSTSFPDSMEMFVLWVSDTDETLGLGLKVSVSGPIPGLGLGLSLDLANS